MEETAGTLRTWQLSGHLCWQALSLAGDYPTCMTGARRETTLSCWDTAKLSDPRVEGVLKDALRDPYTVVSRKGETRHSFQRAAQNSIKKLEAKAKGLDPLAEEKAMFEKIAPKLPASAERK